MIRGAMFTIALAMLAAGVGWLGEAGFAPLVVVHEGEQVRVRGPRGVDETYRDPGQLAWRVPLLSRATVVDTRLRRLDLEELRLGAEGDLARFQVWWRVVDAANFLDAGFEGDAPTSVADRLRDALASLLGSWTLERSLVGTAFEESLLAAAKASLSGVGVEVIAVDCVGRGGARLLREMSAERLARRDELEREVAETGPRLRAEARGEAARIESEALRDAEVARGQTEAEVARIYAEAHATAPEFYTFSRQLEAYRNTLGPNTTLVLSPDHEFFRLLSPPPAAAR